MNQIFHTGTLVSIDACNKQSDGTMFILVKGRRRVQITSELHTMEFGLLANVLHRPDPNLSIRLVEESLKPEDRITISALKRALAETVDACSQNAHSTQYDRYAGWRYLDWSNAAFVADFTVAALSPDKYAMQDILETFNIIARLRKAVALMKRELEIIKKENEINRKTSEKINQDQTRALLEQKRDIIDAMLGGGKQKKNQKVDNLKKLLDRLKNKKVPKEVKAVIDTESEKIQTMELHSSEYSSLFNYLDWLTALPWGVMSVDNFDIKSARKILEEDHYGLEDVKNRILEFIATGKLLNAIPTGRVLCLVGPPGTGKTSIGKSFARALGRKFYRFAMGGSEDVSEVKGHRRTYVNSLPGKLALALKNTQTANPVILIDEVDKIGRSNFHGNPSAALLEALDPAQNNGFIDRYLEVPLDLSKVLFVCTANERHLIPDALADRMEFITLSGYVAHEKMKIAKNYIEPQVRKTTGVISEDIVLADSAIARLVSSYCREAGVRSLEKEIEKVFRKIALLLAEDNQKKIEVNEKNLDAFCGTPKFLTDRMFKRTPVGVVMGLAYTQMGGGAMYIECIADRFTSVAEGAQVVETPITSEKSEKKEKEKKGGLFTTGQMGDVMKESTSIAYTVARAQLFTVQPTNEYFEHHRIHMHAPEGATPKEGPSAGCAMVTALLSLAMNKPVRPDIAMTGEVSLTGKVLAIGGIKEKVIGAKRVNVSELIFPMANKPHYEELPQHVRQDVTAHFCDHYSDVYQVAFFGSAGYSSPTFITIPPPPKIVEDVVQTSPSPLVPVATPPSPILA